MDQQVFNVMWLEENPLDIKYYSAFAIDYGIELHNFSCWENALIELKSNYSKWSAIVLNPKCKLTQGSSINPKRFLPQVWVDLVELSCVYDKMIPWYIFTELDSDKFEEMIVNTRNKYDEDWTQGYYVKNRKDENVDQSSFLFRRIRYNGKRNEYVQIHQGEYKEVFHALAYLENNNLDQEVELILEDLLVSLVYGIQDRNSALTSVRSALEYIARYLLDMGLLPDAFENNKGGANMKNSYRLLAGKQVNIQNSVLPQVYVLDSAQNIVNNVTGNYLYEMLLVCNGASHAKLESGKETRDTQLYLEQSQSNNLLHSYALQLCDVIIWLKKVTAMKNSKTGIPQIWKLI